MVIGRILRWPPGFHTLPPCTHPHIPQDCELDEFYSHDKVCHKELTLRGGDYLGGPDPILQALEKQSVLWLVAEGAARETFSSWPGGKQISMVWTGHGRVQPLGPESSPWLTTRRTMGTSVLKVQRTRLCQQPVCSEEVPEPQMRLSAAPARTSFSFVKHQAKSTVVRYCTFDL